MKAALLRLNLFVLLALTTLSLFGCSEERSFVKQHSDEDFSALKGLFAFVRSGPSRADNTYCVFVHDSINFPEEGYYIARVGHESHKVVKSSTELIEVELQASLLTKMNSLAEKLIKYRLYAINVDKEGEASFFFDGNSKSATLVKVPAGGSPPSGRCREIANEWYMYR